MEAETLVASGLLELKRMVTYCCWCKPRSWKLSDEPVKVQFWTRRRLQGCWSFALFSADCDTLVVHLCPHFSHFSSSHINSAWNQARLPCCLHENLFTSLRSESTQFLPSWQLSKMTHTHANTRYASFNLNID